MADLSLTEDSLLILRTLSAVGMPVAEIAEKAHLSPGKAAAGLAALRTAGYAVRSSQETWSKSTAGQQILADLALRKQSCEARPDTEDLRQALLTLIKTMDSPPPHLERNPS
ncbi:hypothetical protein H9639_05355 [Arthrobacter sp. Sa2CUA1]|uniref:MarR family transcriptional regulator n=1 Tax=Arthrobacter gallicola TaxID=2762225 RepID=A0ABR8UQA0_9MICC|nr:hypothetical protein [Arthrobacter gallicola]MBD7994721.1 hypothetical protein [Arthrobacter gallicola]